MATTPLKTAMRALGIATVMMVGFAAWVLCTQELSSPARTETPAESSRGVSFAAMVDDLSAETVLATAKTAPRRRLDADLTPPKAKPLAVDEPFFDDEHTPPARVAAATANVRKPDARQVPRIQPELGRLSGREQDSAVRDEFDSSDLAVEDVSRPPRSVPTKRQPIAVFRPAEVFSESESSRVETQLTAMQRKIEQLAQAQTDQKTSDQNQIFELQQQIQEQKKTEQYEKLLQQIQEAKKNGDDPRKQFDVNTLLDAAKLLDPKLDPAKEKAKESGATEPPAEENTAPKRPSFMQAKPSAGDSERFESIEFHEADISEALAMLGQLSGMNILIGRGVSGRVPAANLQNITAEQALDAITKSLGYVFEREENFVFVWTAADAAARKQAARKTVSKVFRPRYVSVKDIQALITPMLTRPGGLIAVTTPAELGLEESRTKAGGNSLSQTDALLVVDFPEVLAQIEAIINDIDIPPSQVVIEAMILSVKLTDTMKLGVNFALLNGSNKQLVTTGNGSQINGNVGFNKDTLVPVMGDFVASTAGLKYGFINGDLAGFVEALETLAETSVVASPSVRVLNKQRAELIIGQRLGYKTTTFNGTQSIENINFLEVGTKLLLRPFVTQDGLVRMEIHPERSDGTINEAGLPQSRTTEVTSNVMIRDGSTIVVGGLIEEQANQTQSRVPGLGALPVVGNLFKNKTNDTTRTELIVLITPRIIHDPDAECEGDLSRSENERRHQDYRDKLSPINRHNLARIEYERAARYFDEGDVPRAKRHIDESLRHNPLDNDALRKRDQITAALNDKNWWKKLRRKPPTQYHNVPSSPAALSNGEATFEQEIPRLAPTRLAPVPPAPAAIPEELPPPPVSNDNTDANAGK